MDVDDLGLGEAEVVGEVDECVGFGGADLPVEQGGVEHGQVGVRDRFTGARDPVDEPGQEVRFDMTEGGAPRGARSQWEPGGAGGGHGGQPGWGQRLGFANASRHGIAHAPVG
jgi:hypothetical protein